MFQTNILSCPSKISINSVPKERKKEKTGQTRVFFLNATKLIYLWTVTLYLNRSMEVLGSPYPDITSVDFCFIAVKILSDKLPSSSIMVNAFLQNSSFFFVTAAICLGIILNVSGECSTLLDFKALYK